MLLSMAAAMSGPVARELFDKLRRAYNLMTPHGSVPVPALDEWEGIFALCDKVSCGWVGGWVPVEESEGTLEAMQQGTSALGRQPCSD